MSARLEELDWRETPMGELSLRRRLEPTLQIDVYEVRLGDEFLMSSLFTVAEIELARLGLAAVGGDQLDVLVGGLGLGYTAQAALEDDRIRHLAVVEAQPAVIEWHQRHLLPVSTSLTDDPRCTLVEADFFAGIAATGFGTIGFGSTHLGTTHLDPANLDPQTPPRWHAILLDIDHTPHHLLHPSHGGFYTVEGLERLSSHLQPDGVFALWSDDPPDREFMTLLGQVFTDPEAHVVTFPNHYTDIPSTNTVYVARRA